MGGFSSSNIEYVATLLNDSPGVGGRVHVMPNNDRRFYVSSVQGVRIYDINDPALPILIGALEIANWENEDVSVSRDGKTVLMSEFTGTAYTYVFQVSDPVGPLGNVTISIADALPLSASHIVDCIDDKCDYFYGAEGQIWDARNKTDVKQLSRGWDVQANEQTGQNIPFGSGHNLEVVGDYDLDGNPDTPLQRVAISDTTPMVMMDVTDPVNPIVITTSLTEDHGSNKTAYQHNNKVLNFESYVPRAADDQYVPFDEATPGSGLRTGELLIGNGETNFRPQCGGGSGPLTSWSATNWEKGEQFRVLKTFRPVNGTYDGPDGSGGDPAVNAIGCSGHWFDVRPDDADATDTIVAAAWYEHGTRVIRVDGQTGDFEQLGFFQPVAGSASAAHWIVDESGIFIYTVDYLSGVDIMRYNPEAPLESPQTFDSSWFVADPAVTRFSEQQRTLCRIAFQSATPSVPAAVATTAVLNN
ncbi:MAG: hypothetical protein ACR2HR_06880 [Euzebya sp.]